MENQLFVENSIADTLPAMVKTELAKMPEEKQAQFVEEYKRKKKSVGLAYFFLLICLGMPYGYLGKWGLQIVYWLTGGGFAIWMIILIFTLAGNVRDYNKDVALEVMRNMKAIG